MLGPPEAEELSPQEYIVYKCSKFLIFINFIFFTITFIILPCLLQAYFFKCYSTCMWYMKIFKDYQKFNIFDIIFIYLKYLEKNG